mmetsp:Transcript_5729/g.14574  ORF Transcript_5729/g.14574 Transcript_5729/m.14574 type:complete len:242 (-) Transcript_5729:75-800(-)
MQLGALAVKSEDLVLAAVRAAAPAVQQRRQQADRGNHQHDRHHGAVHLVRHDDQPRKASRRAVVGGQIVRVELGESEHHRQLARGEREVPRVVRRKVALERDDRDPRGGVLVPRDRGLDDVLRVVGEEAVLDGGGDGERPRVRHQADAVDDAAKEHVRVHHPVGAELLLGALDPEGEPAERARLQLEEHVAVRVGAVHVPPDEEVARELHLVVVAHRVDPRRLLRLGGVRDVAQRRLEEGA